jgi:hypothetical protein
VIFAGYTVSAEDAREAYGEQRFLTLGLLRGEVVSVAHTPREDNDHIIRSARLRNMKRASTSGKSRTDVKRLKSMKGSDIVVDKDAPACTPDMFARAIVRKGLEPVAKKSLLPACTGGSTATLDLANRRDARTHRRECLHRQLQEASH